LHANRLPVFFLRSGVTALGRYVKFNGFTKMTNVTVVFFGQAESMISFSQHNSQP
jgi:hypothetical protein